jgi:hypothetical protein
MARRHLSRKQVAFLFGSGRFKRKGGRSLVKHQGKNKKTGVNIVSARNAVAPSVARRASTKHLKAMIRKNHKRRRRSRR